ncbi:6606_t:CDS:2, partial [Diversispora eburnea]
VQDDTEFLNVLQEIRAGNLSQSLINLINSKISVSQNNPLMTTHIVRHCKTADTINNYISYVLHNHLFSNGLCNESIGVVLEILDEENIIVAFPLTQGISCVKVIKETVYF